MMLRLASLLAGRKCLLALALFVSVLSASGQAIRPLISLKFPRDTWKFSEKIYFQDLDHDLDKFVGDWGGLAYNGDSIFLRTSIATEVWSDFHKCTMDHLMLDLRVFHQGKPYPNYEKRYKRYEGLIQGAWFFLDWVTEEVRERNPYKYQVWFDYIREKEEDLYYGSVSVILEMSEDEQVIQARRWSIGFDIAYPNFPPYIAPKPNQVMWTLRRITR